MFYLKMIIENIFAVLKKYALILPLWGLFSGVLFAEGFEKDSEPPIRPFVADFIDSNVIYLTERGKPHKKNNLSFYIKSKVNYPLMNDKTSNKKAYIKLFFNYDDDFCYLFFDRKRKN